MSNIRRTLLFTYLFLNCLMLQVYSQNIKEDLYTSFINYTISEGLSCNTVNDIYQDIYGYIWIATEDGLNRFDGYSFLIYRNQINDSLSISGNIITSIDGDKKGNIWIGTTEGLSFYCRKTGKFSQYKSNIANPNTLQNDHIRKVLLQDSLFLWIETLDGTLSKINLTNGSFSHYTHPPVFQPYYRYHVLSIDNDSIWVGGRSLGLNCFSIKNESFRFFKANPKRPDKKRDDDISAFLKTTDENYFVSGTDGFYWFDPKTELFKKLLASSTYSMAETESHQIFLGTGNGMMLYNPVSNSFTRFKNDINNQKSLINNHINKVFIDREQNIWLGTNSGISLLRKKEAVFKHYFHIPGLNGTLSGNDISSILKDSKGKIWIGTSGNGLNYWNLQKNEFEHFRHNQKNPSTISSNNITKLYEDKSGRIWVGLWSGVGFNLFNPDNRKFTRYALNLKSLKVDWYNDIIEDSRGNLWMGIWGGMGIQRFDRTKFEFNKNENFYSSHIPINQNINNMVYDGCGNLFIQSGSPVIFHYIVKDNSFKAHVSVNKQSGEKAKLYTYYSCDLPFDNDTILSISTNRNGITVIATDKGVVSYSAGHNSFVFLNKKIETVKQLVYDKNKGVFQFFSDNYIYTADTSLRIINSKKLPKPLRNINLLKIGAWTEGVLWILTEKGIVVYSSDKNIIEKTFNNRLDSRFEPTKLVNIGNKLLLATNKGLWCLWKDGSLKRINYKSNSILLSNIQAITPFKNNQVLLVSKYGFALFNLDNNELKPFNINKLPVDFGFSVNAIDSSSDKLFFSSNKNIYEFETKEKTIRQINIPDKYMVSSRLTSCLLEDSSGNLWIGTTDNGLNRHDIKTNQFYHFFKGNSPESLPSEKVTCLMLSSENKVWIGTNEGLCAYNEKSRIIERYSENWPVKQISFITESSDSTFWIGTPNGLIKFYPHVGKFEHFGISDGLPVSTFNKSFSWLAPDSLLLGTNQGIVLFNPHLLKKANIKRPVEITGISVFGKTITNELRQNSKIELPYNKNFFSIFFSSMDYDLPGSINYSYTLTGMDDRWVETSTNSAIFTNLKPGTYVFNVTLKGFEYDVSLQTSLLIIITPPFWKTSWFIFIILAITLSVIFVILKEYIKQIKIRERNILLEQKLLASQMNPHFIFNSLSAIQSFIYSNEAEMAGNYLSDFSRLVRLILENSRSEWISITKEIQTLKLYIDLQKLRFSDKFDYSIEVDPKINRKLVHIPPMLAQPFIENSIEHGILHKKDKGYITISFKLSEKYIIIEVTDDGVGLKQSAVINKNREQHTSFATSITRERIINMKQRRSDRNGITVIDREDTEGVKGVKVTINIPYKEYVQTEQTKI